MAIGSGLHGSWLWQSQLASINLGCHLGKFRLADYSEVGIAKQRSPTMKISRPRHGRTIKRAKRVERPER